MKILSIYDNEFRKYGRIINNIDFTELVETLETKTPLPEGVIYKASEEKLEALPIFDTLKNNLYGGMPIQIGFCNGHNTRLNCLEFHRDSEFNIGSRDFILLLATREDYVDGNLDSSKVKAFKVPKGVMIECYATTFHYCPCQASKEEGFKMIVLLPKGTNLAKPEITNIETEDRLLFASNKWLIAHKDTNEAKDGAYIGISGENLDIKDLI